MCPGFERLIDYLDGRLDAVAAQTVTAHLASGCARCAEDRRWYESVKATAKADDSTEPPPWVLQRAIKLFETGKARGGLSARVGGLIAGLIYDSFARPAIAGARTTEAADHQLLYKADDYNIDLMLATAGRQTNLRGQILREGEFQFESTAGISLDLLLEGRSIQSTRTNEVGEFAISGISSGQYDLRLEVGELNITIAGLTIV